MNLNDFLRDTRQQLENRLLASFDAPKSERLRTAMRYSLLNGGKRLRPALVRAAALAAGNDTQDWLIPAMALEMIHVYSLVHDDLPAMDNDDLRRGKATNHKEFDEATAILAGDALQTEAFAILAGADSLNDRQARQMIAQLSQAAGANGMVGGQMIDLQSEQKTLTLSQLEKLHALKTGALIQAALQLGVLCQSPLSGTLLSAFERYGRALGLAFQITDDILDVTASTEVLGKPQGSDLAADKATYVSLLGLPGAQQQAVQQHQLALGALAEVGMDAQTLLGQLATYVIQRDH
ncbi:farnesyl diphosphate synthase [Reinekea sp.]|jgi:geranylgeranyl pyrophosphate synthase|uniref:polyprenyl synthetase family protein n=1 Tax=Reinekea sp. TaxID=1970455 RepID=UPI002A80BD08|nr:farnesyl diphosphate synthase [Reinekea sp.]